MFNKELPMRRQPRAFTVEIRQKRSSQKRSRSIWGDVDLTAATAETRRELEEMELPNRRLVDSSVVALDAEHMHKPRAEHLMANPLDAEPVTTATQRQPNWRRLKRRRPNGRRRRRLSPGRLLGRMPLARRPRRRKHQQRPSGPDVRPTLKRSARRCSP
ncbi:hypothetical protein MES4922_10137 [Mesorhizobium ventifaucium]|uniref:Uncharacterized protein n=1 Tax=Mesorhizobium ventifaucium TaxID=666020 RepID=A0ABN8J7S9_9HYPH|nr:hypothetical protein MES4922_10137 [Mesorhizobium ventifaucium]